MDEAQFWLWLDDGIRNGFCCEVFCLDHDGPTYTEEEYQDKELFDEVCVPMVRLYEPGLSQATGTVAEPADSPHTIDDLPQTEHGKETPLTRDNRVDSPRP